MWLLPHVSFALVHYPCPLPLSFALVHCPCSLPMSFVLIHCPYSLPLFTALCLDQNQVDDTERDAEFPAKESWRRIELYGHGKHSYVTHSKVFLFEELFLAPAIKEQLTSVDGRGLYPTYSITAAWIICCLGWVWICVWFEFGLGLGLVWVWVWSGFEFGFGLDLSNSSKSIDYIYVLSWPSCISLIQFNF